jgi:hypothetical protein
MSHPQDRPVGTYEIIHTVRPGESLSLIARHYEARSWPLHSWRPIYNITRLKTGLWNTKGTAKQHDNPDLIHPGNVVIIPRSPQGYDLRIAQIIKLAEDVRKQKNDIPAIREEMEKKAKQIDLISDVLQLIVTCGGSAIRGAKAAKGLTGLAAKEALEHQREAYKEIGKEVAKFATEKGTEAINENLGSATKVGTKSIGKAVEISKAAVAVKHLKDAGMLLARGVDFVLDWVSPSKVAMLYIRLKDGEWPEDTLNHMELAIEQSKVSLLKHLADRAHELRQEKHAVYGGSE